MGKTRDKTVSAMSRFFGMIRGIAPRIVVCWMLILAWEIATLPETTVANPWQGVWLSISLLALTSYLLSRLGMRPSNLFVYGFSASLLFMPRYLVSSHTMWMSVETSSGDLVLAWTAIAIVFGLLCWGAGRLQSQCDNDGQKSVVYSRWIHGFLWMGCLVGYLGVVWLLATSREFLSYRIGWPFVVITVWHSIGASAGLFSIVLFVARAAHNTSFPTCVGEFLLLASGLQGAFALAGQGALVFLSTSNTIVPCSNCYEAIIAVGSAVSAMLMLIPYRRIGLPWRAFLGCYSSVFFLQCFGLAFGGIRYEFIHSVLRLLVAMILLVVILLSFSKNDVKPWTHWLGVAVELWFSLMILIRFSVGAGFGI